ncbi:MAG: amidase [Pseudomonadota bacterium]|nr:amidase [Pseudomonadota bacterium]
MIANPCQSISAQADKMLRQEVTSSELVEQCCRRIEALDSRLGAFQLLCLERAREAGRAVDHAIASGHRIGPFHGIPFALKDIIDVEGLPTTAGCQLRTTHISRQTATIAQRLLSAGGIFLGKTKTVEFAFGGWGTNQRMGTPWNPWDSNCHRTPGGSSSGSAVAVSAGLAGCAVGTDTGGSVRLPAAMCGIVGLKVSQGALPVDGIVPLSHTLDTPGPMARCVSDVALMYETLLGRNPAAVEQDRKEDKGLWYELKRGIDGMLLGELSPAEREGVEADVLMLYDDALELLRQHGARIEIFQPSQSFDDLKHASGVIMAAEGYYYHGSLYANQAALLDEDVRPRMLAGASLSAAEYIDALCQRKKDQAVLGEQVARFDAIVTPTTPTTARPIQALDQSVTPAYFTRAANYLGLCGLSLPMGLTAEGLPGGLQILSPAHQEATVLRIGAEYERHRPQVGAPPF